MDADVGVEEGSSQLVMLECGICIDPGGTLWRAASTANSGYLALKSFRRNASSLKISSSMRLAKRYRRIHFPRLTVPISQRLALFSEKQTYFFGPL